MTAPRSLDDKVVATTASISSLLNPRFVVLSTPSSLSGADHRHEAISPPDCGSSDK